MTIQETKIEQLNICRDTVTLVHNYKRFAGEKVTAEFVSEFYNFTKEIDNLVSNPSTDSQEFWNSLDVEKYANSKFFKECCKSPGLLPENVRKLREKREQMALSIIKSDKSVIGQSDKSVILSYIIENNITNSASPDLKELDNITNDAVEDDYTNYGDNLNFSNEPPPWVSEEIPINNNC